MLSSLSTDRPEVIWPAAIAAVFIAVRGPDNSSKPPSQGQKQNRPDGEPRPPRKSRPGVGRALHPNPDRVIDARLAACPKCAAVLRDNLDERERQSG